MTWFGRKKLPLESLRLGETAAGTPAMHLTNEVSPDEFAGYARNLLTVLEGTLEKRVGSPLEQVWEVRIRQKVFWLACDEAGVSPEPRDKAASALVAVLYQRLLSYRETGS